MNEMTVLNEFKEKYNLRQGCKEAHCGICKFAVMEYAKLPGASCLQRGGVGITGFTYENPTSVGTVCDLFKK